MNIGNLGLYPVVSGNSVYITWLEEEKGNTAENMMLSLQYLMTLDRHLIQHV